MTEQELDNAVEALLDSTSLSRVLEATIRVCYAKAEHLLSNWQDGVQAAEWENVATCLAGLVGEAQQGGI